MTDDDWNNKSVDEKLEWLYRNLNGLIDHINNVTVMQISRVRERTQALAERVQEIENTLRDEKAG